MAATEADDSVIRKAGKATAVLQFFAVGLVVVLGFIYNDISSRYTAMQSGVRENAMWSVYQLDREARNLENMLSMMLASGNIDMPAQKELSMRYDILYSRMDMLGKAKYEQFFAVDATVAKQLSAIQHSVFTNVGIFDDIGKGKPASRASLVIAWASFQSLIANTEHLVSYTNNTLSTDRAESRDQVASLEKRSLILIGFLALIVGALILTLRRQLSSVRAAGLSFERMAGNLESAYRAAEAGNRAKSQFMATMGHEIRTPLNAILGTVGLMELSPTDAEAGRNLKTIRKSGEALLDIINEILDFSKIEHGKLELESRTIDLRSMAENAIEMMRGRALDSGNQIDLDIAADLAAPFIKSDATRLRQVVVNLMSNAVKFTTNGTVTLRMRQQGSRNGIRLRIEVEDTGIGIDQTGRCKLFLPFSQVDASITRKYGGTGLGLTICKEIVERLGGEIGVDSIRGSGSTFWFEIPVEAAPAPVDGSLNGSPVADGPLPRLKVLVVEDNAVNLHVATKFLAHLHQETHCAENGAIAIQKASEERFDLILMDMQMPIMDGIEATKQIRNAGGPSSATPIFAMTANASDDDRQKCTTAGMTGFQSKPIGIAQLRAIISAAARNRPAGTPISSGQDDSIAEKTDAGSELQVFYDRKREMIEVLGEDDFAELLGTFFEDMHHALAELETACRQQEEGQIDRLLHTIKGAAGNVGLGAIAATSQRMRERAFSTREMELLQAEIGRYKSLLAA